MLRYQRVAAAAAIAIAAFQVTRTNAYTPGVAKWPSSAVTIYANPSNLDTDATSAEDAIKAAISSWGSQSNANFRFVYGGRVNDTATANDKRNVLLFRNATNGSAIASTYAWYSGSTLTDTDTVFWDGYMPFFGNNSSCSGGAYIQDIATHELGHALGLGHSSVGDATMYPSYSTCSQELRSLSADDIAGVEYLYPPSSAPSNTAPNVSISSPSGSFVDGTMIAFSGSATDSQDGTLSNGLTWSSSLSGVIGSGASFSRTLPIGTHVITASVTDSGGMTSSQQTTVSITAASAPPPPPPPAPTSNGPTLSARGYKIKGVRAADLTWSNLATATAKVFRNSSQVYSGPNTGKDTDKIGGKGAGSFTYRVCDDAQTVCSNTVTVSF